MKEKQDKQLSIRFPLEVFERIEKMRDERSFNAQVIWILKDYFKQQDAKREKRKEC